MKLLIVPDVHGRDFWRDPCYEHYNEFDKIIFLGDYLDHYRDESTREHDIETLEDIISFKKEHLDKVILLIGNHDCPYIWPDTYGRALGSYWCRHDNKNHKKINEIFNDNIDLFTLAWDCPYKESKLLITHAGVNQGYKGICGTDASQINDFFLKGETKGMPNVIGLAGVSWYRGGHDKWGSPVWADVNEHINWEVKEVYQIFGHTYSYEILVEKYFMMLDIGKNCWSFDTEGEFEVNEVH